MRKRGGKETKRGSERKSDVTERERRSGRERGRRRERRSEKESGTVNVKEQRRKSGRKREAVIVAKTEADQGRRIERRRKESERKMKKRRMNDGSWRGSCVKKKWLIRSA